MIDGIFSGRQNIIIDIIVLGVKVNWIFKLN